MAKSGIVNALDGLPWILKIIFSLPGLDIIWAIYRIIKGATENKLLVLVFGILWIIPGAAICWIVDLVSTIVFKKVVVFA